MATLFRWIALIAFFLAMLAATSFGARLARVPWIAVGLFFWLLSVMVVAGNLGDID